MKLLKYFLCLLLIFIFGQRLLAQKEGNIWYFGEYAGLDFNSGSPVALTNSAMFSQVESSCISDSLGGLLFYTNGVDIFNKDHKRMPSSEISQHAGSSTVIVKKPGSSTLYYIFATGDKFHDGDLYYTTVDMSKDLGRGDVSIKRTLLLKGFSNRVAAAMHKNGSDIWIVTHLDGSDSMFSYLLTPTGLKKSPVVSKMKYKTLALVGALPHSLMVSSDGSHAVMSDIVLNRINLFDFDNSSGKLSHRTYIPISRVGGCEYSPNGHLLYISSSQGRYAENLLYQFDLQARSDTAILSSGKVIYRYKKTPSNQSFMHLRLGPDNKIYCNGSGDSFLSVIKKPNIRGIGCNYSHRSLWLGGGKVLFGLPNFINTISKHSFTTTGLCDGDSTFFRVTDETSVASVFWNFDDPNSGSRNFSREMRPHHKFSDSGVYWVKVVLHLKNGSKDSAIKKISISAYPQIFLGNDTILCEGESLILNASTPKASYRWHNNSKSAMIKVRNTGQYWVEVEQNSCIVRDTIGVVFNAYPTFSLGRDTAVCEGETLELKANSRSPDVNYKWVNGSKDSSIEVLKPGTYWLEIGRDRCISRDTISVVFKPLPVVDLGKDTVLCMGEELTLRATYPNARYLWHDQSSDSIFRLSQPGLYWVEVSENGCETKDSINVTFKPLPMVDLGKDTVLCMGEELIIQAGGTNVTYLWQDLSKNSSFRVSKGGIYWVEVSENRCTSRDSISISFKPLPFINLGNDTTLCEGEKVSLKATRPNATYLWQDNTKDSTFVVTRPGNYWVKISQNNCTSGDTITVTFESKPFIDLGKDTNLCEGATLILDALSPGSTFLWQNQSDKPTFEVSTAGLYWLEITQNTCKSRDSIQVNFTALPFIDLGKDTFVCNGEILNLNAYTPNATYLWQDGSSNSSFIVSEPGIYRVKVDVDMCSSFDEVKIKGKDCNCYLHMPNAFSPNYDQLNENYGPKFNCDIKEYHFIILNRWGQKVFETYDYKQSWDGRFDGKSCPSGIYIYRLNYVHQKGNETRKGTINLIR